VGPAGQERLKAARIVVVGAGGLGSPAALYSRRQGSVPWPVDFEPVDVSNLQRQILHGTAAVGRPKVGSAAERLADLNPDVRVIAIDQRLSSANAREILAGFDIVVDGSDNFHRYLVNDVCVWLGKPLFTGASSDSRDKRRSFTQPRTVLSLSLRRSRPPPNMVPSCAEGGVLACCRASSEACRRSRRSSSCWA